MSKEKEKINVEEESVKEIKTVKEDKMTSVDFASAKGMGKYYEEQFRMMFGEEKKTVSEWKKYLLDKQIVSEDKLN